MKTKLRIILILSVLAILAVFLLINRRPNEASKNPEQVADQTENRVVSEVKSANNASNNRPGETLEEPRQTSYQNLTNAIYQDQNEWRTPIDFFGKVIDEASNVVADANIHFEWTDLSPDGTSKKNMTSDAGGMFSLRGVTGKALTVQVSKPGYYSYQNFPVGFFYAGENENFVPDEINPVVFKLKKRGHAESLIRFNKSYRLPRDGGPIQIDLQTGKEASTGNALLKVECWTQDANKRSGEHYDWLCRISVVSGGIQAYSEQFPFLAPELDYKSSDEIDMKVVPDKLWQRDVKRQYFIRTSDSRFGRISFRMIAHGEHFCQIESYFNPSGSRNLEYDPAVQPSPIVHE